MLPPFLRNQVFSTYPCQVPTTYHPSVMHRVIQNNNMRILKHAVRCKATFPALSRFRQTSPVLPRAPASVPTRRHESHSPGIAIFQGPWQAVIFDHSALFDSSSMWINWVNEIGARFSEICGPEKTYAYVILTLLDVSLALMVMFSFFEAMGFDPKSFHLKSSSRILQRPFDEVTDFVSVMVAVFTIPSPVSPCACLLVIEICQYGYQ